MLTIVGIAVGIALALTVFCVIIAVMFPPKEYKGMNADGQAGRQHN